MKLFSRTTDDAAPPWTTFKIDPQGLNPDSLVERIPATVPGGSFTDLAVVDGMVCITVPAAGVAGVVGRLKASGDGNMQAIAALLED